MLFWKRDSLPLPRGFGMASVVQHESALWRRLVEPDWDALTPDVARYLLRIEFTDDERDRVSELSAKARAGSLSEPEGRELDSFIRAANTLTIWHAKAQQFLNQSSTHG
jgi:hypothetical protein